MPLLPLFCERREAARTSVAAEADGCSLHSVRNRNRMLGKPHRHNSMGQDLQAPRVLY